MHLKISPAATISAKCKNGRIKFSFNLSFLLSKVMKKLCMEPPDRLTSLQTLWENNKPAEPGPCGRNL